MSAADVACDYAVAQVGKPYVWGGVGPNGFDCSGLIQTAYKQAGINLPRTSYQMLGIGSPVAKEDVQRGDIVWPYPGHVFLALGGNEFVEAPTAGKTVRTFQGMYAFNAARRVTTPGTGSFSATNAINIGNPLSGLTNAVRDLAKLAELLGDPHTYY